MNDGLSQHRLGMTAEAFRRADVPASTPTTAPTRVSHGGDLAIEDGGTELSPAVRAELLDLGAWEDILTMYGRTMGVAVALTDVQGRLLGKCHNPQPVWKAVHAVPGSSASCPFCLTTSLPCTAVAESFRTSGAVIVRDQIGLTHVAVPLLLGRQRIGAIVAGQVFHRYPEPLSLRRVAKDFGVSAQELWAVARTQRPVSDTMLQATGDLLCALGKSFLLQRYGVILETRLAEANGRFRLLVEGVRDYALFTVDLTGGVVSWNIGAERMFGYASAAIIGRNFSCLFTEDDIQNGEPEKQLNRALHAGWVEREGWRLRENGEVFVAHVNITPLDEGGFAVIMRDVTEQGKISTILEETRQARARLQEKFLSHVSHELRTPLTAIHFFTTNVLDGLLGDLTPPQREHLEYANENVQQLKGMVDDLLDIGRVDAHKLILEPQHASAVALIAEVLVTCRTNAVARKVELRSQVSPDIPFVWADPARVRQVLINLIDNGIKSTPPGGTVTVGSRLSLQEDGFLCLSVSDTGSGISQENRELVFDRLAQIKSGVESRSGLGLGLFISRELVSRHGGRIWVESQVDHGSTFYFTLPVFSLVKLCSRVLTASNLAAGSVALLTVDVTPVEGSVQAEILPDLRRILERCIRAGQDLVLPEMSDAEPVDTFFVVACADSEGSEVLGSRIARGLQTFDVALRLKPIISTAILRVAAGLPHEEQISDVTSRIDGLVQAHLLEKERLK